MPICKTNSQFYYYYVHIGHFVVLAFTTCIRKWCYAIKKALFFSGGIKPVSIAISALSSIVIWVFGGTLKFKKANILSMEE